MTKTLIINTMPKYCWILLLMLAAARQSAAQEIQLNEDPKIAQLLRNWTNENRATPSVEGWRVQVTASTDREQVEQSRTRFRLEYPDVPAVLFPEKPYYKLRVGAFRTKQEALAFIATLSNWPGAYPAKDPSIHPRDFLEQ
jgi:hypothetical protein